MLLWHRGRPILDASLEVTARKDDLTPTKAELSAIYAVSALFFLIMCLGCGVYRNRKRDVNDLREIRRAQLAAAMFSETPPEATHLEIDIPQVYSFLPSKDIAKAPCPVCLEDFGRIPVSQGTCEHPIHTECLMQWFVRDPNLSCPVCRTKYETVSCKRSTCTSESDQEISRCSDTPTSDSDERSDESIQQQDEQDLSVSFRHAETVPQLVPPRDVILPMSASS